MTYNVFGVTLNLAQSAMYSSLLFLCACFLTACFHGETKMHIYNTLLIGFCSVAVTLTSAFLMLLLSRASLSWLMSA